MNKQAKLLSVLAISATLAAGQAHAEPIVRDPSLIASMDIQGVTLAMTPREAFDHLAAQGYRAGNIANFEDWREGGISFVKGDFSSPTGRSEITLQRLNTGGRLTNISETLNRRQDQLDPAAEVEAVRNHFGVTEDNPDCRVSEAGTGSCRVGDAAEGANHVYGVSALPGMIMRYASRNKELKDSY